MRTLNYLVLLLSAVLAFFSFAISYSALERLASTEGISPAALFPLIIDGIIILALTWRLYGNDRDCARLVMAGYVCLSIGLNAVSHGTILGSLMAAVAPISLFITSEIAASMLHQKRDRAVKAIINTGIMRDARGRFIKQDVQ